MQRRGRSLTIEIALYGFAGYWAPAVADAHPGQGATAGLGWFSVSED
ncbi:hypothetical protein [Tistrella mobilis]